ncbi:sugar transferase [Sphingomonas sp. Y38-1Y]|uniref:sugar transferase n=1 Tax=Sphingomonas sp. Y38-1Y TaxID=3078265 RepID=UPI0028E5EF5F|nr:sugar transferase [Sphingomonas sp. Y38-1Y]
MLLRLENLAVALALAVLPAIMAVLFPEDQVNQTVVFVTYIYSLISTTIGLMLFRSIIRYPGVEATAYILPSFTISFGILLTFLILSRLQYSRSLLFVSFVVVIVWYVIVYAADRRRRMMTIGIVPGGDSLLLLDVSGVRWFRLNDPAELALVDAVSADLRVDLPTEWDRALADCALAGVPVYHTKHLAESLTGMVQLEHLSENSFGTLAPISAYMTIKHCVDWLAAVVVGILLAPLMVLIAVVIRLDSRGPSIFRQTRIGYRGKPFTVYKFRTMSAAPAGQQALDAAKTQTGDKRITKVGAFLRRSRVDELPQILNILKGEMSWIGPRPEAQVLSQWYESEIPFYRYRHIVRPGLTGWAQVHQGHVAEVEDVKTKLYYDFYYIKTYSPWIDLLIVAKTVQTVLNGFGAK